MKHDFKLFLEGDKIARVMVIGDLILDEYIWGSVNRISPEAPVPVLESKSENRAIGGAGNVANNLVALGCEVYIVGAIGQDEKGDRLIELLQERGVNTEGIYRYLHRPTTSKIRILAHNQQILRIDKEDDRQIPEEVEQKFIAYINKILPSMDGVICSDYQKGMLTPKILQAIMKRAKNSKKEVIVDPKGDDFSIYKGASLITPNKKEIEGAVPIKINNEEDMERAAQYLMTLTKAKAVLVTRGKEGMTLYQAKSKPVEISTRAREVFDVTGAGDTAISVLARAVFHGLDYQEAATLANMAAGIVVGKLGTAVVTLKEINHYLQEELLRVSSNVLDFSELSQIISHAKSLGKKVVFTNGCFDIIHGGHIEFLQRAKALGDVLVVGLNSDDSVRHLKGDGRPIKNEHERANILSALKYVDYITIFNELTPESLIRGVRPDVLVKGDDYKLEEVVGRDIVESYGARVELVPIVQGLSTTGTVEKIRRAGQAPGGNR